MKKTIISIFFLFFFNKLFAADYNNLPTIQKTLFSTNEVHLSCFNNEIQYSLYDLSLITILFIDMKSFEGLVHLRNTFWA